MMGSFLLTDQEACRPCRKSTADTIIVPRDHHQDVRNIAQNRTVRTIIPRCDSNIPEMKQTQSLLASELYRLSKDERSRALDDVHCVGQELSETPELIQKSLNDFEQTVRKVRSNHPIYEIAESQNRAYVEDENFRLKFLRANFHNVAESVCQMMSFLKHKATCFGQEKVAREIDLSDLTEEDIQTMISIYHIQDGRDRMGRPIVHYFETNLEKYKATNTLGRVTYYIWWNVVLQVPGAQAKGVASIYHSLFRMPDIGFHSETNSLFNSLPLRLSVTHYCCIQTTSSLERNPFGSYHDALLSLILSAASQYARVRSRIHCGSSTEIQCQLKCHGIPMDTFPLDLNGNLRREVMNLWFEKHLMETNQQSVALPRMQVAQLPPQVALGESDSYLWEQQQSSSYWHANGFRRGLDAQDQNYPNQIRSSISSTNHLNPEPGGDDQAPAAVSSITPTDIDVLFGKGYRVQSHPGNCSFRDFLEEHRWLYDDTPRQWKREICTQLVDTLRGRGVRFLQKVESSGQWVETQSGEPESKIAQMFREFRKKEQRQGNEP